ncbi:histidine phosphatase family protein [Nocardioides koreensis]|uniref:Histidine phosphatase family protein n=1 Tax=Nocardioides koreensis TaxID=433651 RepID=A0ABP5LUQ0_9ACTN
MTDRTLVLLRHGKSDWSGDEADVDRPLADRGRRQAPKAGRWLAANVEGIDVAVVSPALRARSTWELVSAELAVPPTTRIDERAYAASGEELLDVVRGLDDDLTTVVLVGHNPGLEDLASLLAGRWVPLVTSALAVLSLSGSWSTAGEGPASLRASGRPPD